MKNKDYFKGKQVLVAGLARSGVASANLLHDLGAQVFITDNQDNANIRRALNQLKSKDIKVELGRHSRDFVRGKDSVVVSPGLPNNALPVIWAKDENIPVISEIELAWILCPAQVIAVTGTNGKTTVTTLIGEVLSAAGKRAFTCGNIGRPFCAEVGKMQEGDLVALEISSFQLEHIDTFKPKICVFLNLSRNHLDRYKDMAEYLKAKKRIFQNQDAADYAVLNYDDPAIRSLVKELRSTAVYFRKEEGLNPNQSAVLSVAALLGINKDLAIKVFGEFKGVEHRLEDVLEINGVRFINDSKSTTTEATVWALNNLSGPLVLIAGGREKGNDYSKAVESAAKKVKAAVLIGEAKEKIKKVFSGSLNTLEAATLEEAVKKAYQLAIPGDCVLFSPMCKSFDMFSDYEDRGRSFKNIVFGLDKVKV
ncbi:MAG: UDP-N-acetylmuramoyl-L-alanine--D-glutamate ligase [Candidatus Omnitrophica bacterium]|nr:UDP-N-acetylmuramoyl-L-alanine--D-glutamate ligase [Candidatus Omnitrophota bacterium]MDD5662177.1 UDP-N-acetylmuramoyl-L-alanine--D-glutamate ligase [Candidatus Omnitrophota bacterium]